jgi:hypothetical protein
MGVVERAYDMVFQEEEDARACTDIPDEACTRVPRNFGRILASSTATALADELSSAKTVLPWLLAAMGAASFWTGLLVPVRESMSLLPQLFIAAPIRRLARRKYAWIGGGIVQAVSLAGIAAAGLFLRGAGTGAVVIVLLLIFSLARGLTSIASKDVIGKTIPKRRRGRLNGAKSAAAGVLTVLLGFAVIRVTGEGASPGIIAAMIMGAAGLWVIASGIFAFVEEEPGATSGGVNAFTEAIKRLALLRTDGTFRRFVLTRALLVSTALAGPYYVMLAREYGTGASLLGFFVAASGIASAVSSLVWGSLADRSSRTVLVTAAGVASVLGVAMFVVDRTEILAAAPVIAPVAFLLLSIAHAGVRIGRKTYVLDLAGGEKRTDYVAVGNTVIGAVLILGSLVGALTTFIGPSGVLLILSGFGFVGVIGGFGLPEVE